MHIYDPGTVALGLISSAEACGEDQAALRLRLLQAADCLLQLKQENEQLQKQLSAAFLDISKLTDPVMGRIQQSRS